MAAERILCLDASNGAVDEHLAASLSAILAHTAYAMRIRLYLPCVSDRSTHDRLDDLAARVGFDMANDLRIELHPGVAGGLAGILDTLPPHIGELLFVSAGIRVPPGWDTRLRTIAAHNPRIGSISPLCVGLPPFSECYPSQKRGGTSVSVEEWRRHDRFIAEIGVSQHLQLPLLLPICCYLSGAAVMAVRNREGSLLTGIEHAGLMSLTAVNLLVDWDPKAAAGEALPPDYLDVASQYSERFEWLRRALAERSCAPQQPASRPVQLHIAHSWGGGLGHWVDDFVHGDDTRINLVLKSIGSWDAFGQRLELYATYSDMPPRRVWSLTRPIQATDLAQIEYRDLLREIIADYGVQAILVSSLIGHSLDALSTGLPTLLVAHDHYPFCITLYAYFNGVCEDCDGARLRRCMAENPGHHFFRSRSAEDWEALRRAFVQSLHVNPVTLVVPAASVLARWRRQMPSLAELPARVIPHGLGLPPCAPLAGADGGRLRLVIPGRLSWAKGLSLLEQALPVLGSVADIHLLGCGSEGRLFARLPGVFITEQYARGQFGEALAAIRPHFGLLCSLVPETFSYTLSELNHYGIPVLATRVGSFVDRIDDGRTGFFYTPDAEDLIRAVRMIDQHRERLAVVRDHLQREPRRDLATMVRDYHVLLPLPPAGAPRKDLMHLPRAQDVEILYVNSTATYAMTLQAFIRYSIAKFQQSPRLPGWVRKLFGLRRMHAVVRRIRLIR